MARIGDLFPFGDVDETVVRVAADRFEQIPVEHLVAGFTLAKAIVRVLEWLPAPLEEAGLSPARWRLLMALLFQAGPEGATIGALAEHLGVREPTVTATVDRVVADGLVERRRDAVDRRVVRVAVTPIGVERVAAMLPTLARRMTDFIDSLDGPDRVLGLATRLADAVDAADAAVLTGTN